MSNNLTRFQWQIGQIVMGAGTQYEVVGTKIPSYNVNAQDSQIPLSDRTTMGQDTRQAQPLTLTIGVKDNAPARNIAGHLPDDLVSKASKLLGALQDEWYADDVKQQWGQYKALTFCDGYGVVKQIWGRPGKFEYTPKTKTSQYRKVQADFRRMDTLAYAEIEQFAGLVEGAGPQLYQIDGEANTWFRLLFYGPATNPIAVVGDTQIQLDYTIPSGDVVEVSGYPWQQRIVDNHGVNLRTKLVGATKFLDELRLPKNRLLQMSWTAGSTTVASQCFVLWHNAYNVI